MLDGLKKITRRAIMTFNIEHITTHLPDRVRCDFCGMVNVNPEDMRLFENTHHGYVKIMCDNCFKELKELTENCS